MEPKPERREKIIDWRKLRRKISRTKSLTLPRKPREMPACVPLTNNNVTDVNANMERTVPPGGESKFSKIMTCLFFKKKTDVVDMSKDSVKKRKMAVDRSERSRRVLQMDTARDAPTERADAGEVRPPSAGSHRMFLPSENPTAAFLSNLNPSVRRACSDVIRNTSLPSSRPPTREAFADGKRPLVRNTNYRGKQVSQSQADVPPQLPERKPKTAIRSQSQTLPVDRKPIVVPGANVLSEEDFGYNSEHEISNLQEELKRMNFNRGDIHRQLGKGKTRRREDSSRLSSSSLSREGSISLSEGSLTDDESDDASVRPPNPPPLPQTHSAQPDTHTSTTNDISRGQRADSQEKDKSMEDVIDELFLQTKTNIDTIYQNGLEKMNLEAYRAETATPETCMRKLEEDLRLMQESPPNTVELNKPTGKPTVKSILQSTHAKPDPIMNDVGGPRNGPDDHSMDTLLNEVSVWAKDRQTWLLEGGKDKNSFFKENTDSSMKTDDRIINNVKISNTAKCNMWIDSQVDSENSLEINNGKKPNGILTGPKLFRSTRTSITSRKVSFSDNGEADELDNETDGAVTKKNMENSEMNIGKSNNLSSEKGYESNDLISAESVLAPWSEDMYNCKDDDDDKDRSTLNDSLPELDKKDLFRPRSPDSWLSSVCDYSTLMEKKDEPGREDHTDSFDNDNTSSPWGGQSKKHIQVQRAATEPARSHQIIRQKPVIHAPFRNIEKHTFNFDAQYNPISPVMPLMRNTQLRPLPAQRPPRAAHSFVDKPTTKTLPSLASLKSDNIFFKGSRNMNELDAFTFGSQTQRPFSEIPVRPEMKAVDDYPAGAVGSPRPNSETIPTKRAEKIGMGQVMMTDSNVDRQRYARDIVKSLQKPKPETQNAFEENTKPDENDLNNKPVKHKRHTVFNNNLLTGGYKYDKHSRSRSGAKADFINLEKVPSNDLIASPRQRYSNGVDFKESDTEGSRTPKGVDLKSASVSELSLTLREGREDRLRQNGIDPRDQRIYHSLHSNDRFAEALKAQHMVGLRLAGGDLTRTNLTTGIGGRSVGGANGGVTAEIPQPDSMKQTADRLKKLRTRRDIEMEWLMKDAAETEV